MPDFGTALAGYALVGIGCANIEPVMFTQAGRQSVMPEHLAIPAVTTIGYADILLGPAAIGSIANQRSLVAAFILVAVLLATAAIVGARLSARTWRLRTRIGDVSIVATTDMQVL